MGLTIVVENDANVASGALSLLLHAKQPVVGPRGTGCKRVQTWLMLHWLATWQHGMHQTVGSFLPS